MSSDRDDQLRLAGICGYCEALLMPDEAHEHFNLIHPGEDWKLRIEPEGWPTYIEVPNWIEDGR